AAMRARHVAAVLSCAPPVVQVRVTTLLCGQLPAVVTSAKVSVGLASQASVAVGVVKLGAAGHSTVPGAGSAEITGAVVSTTVITWLRVAEIGRASCRDRVRVAALACAPLPAVVAHPSAS